ncbi:hypothetical protein Amsp01_035480 [Amycolatopsis sp. NBRC 101858]|uniref:hypothetical protein n=1 Tax=Amycolatopsis sp. NBRC 101858 TaxID=3032200 RepID=UPI0024A5979A|nr:hypothetical protein [Amycolatopsis sp. NBRC 101858]GLY37524.1 hypothetical protein Amsp01_035480 [Amycolatopsis sp. NBRC 101858]
MDDNVWTSRSVLDKVCGALGQFAVSHLEGHHFGQPFATAYQPAIRVDQAHPEYAVERVRVQRLGGRHDLPEALLP